MRLDNIVQKVKGVKTCFVQSKDHKKMFHCIDILQCVTVEPVLFAFMLGTFLNIPVTQQIIFEKTCIQLFNESFCQNNLTHESCAKSTKQQDLVQSQTSQWIFYQTLARSIPSIISSLLLGSWSDKFGRKVVILLPLIGASLESISAIVNIHFFNASPAYLLFGNIISGMFGSYSTILMAVFAYISDITKDKTNRTLRIGLLESMTFLGGTVGQLISGILIDHVGFIAPFIITLSLNVLMSFYVLVILRESYFPPEQYQSFFSFNNFKGSVQICTKRRQQHQRLYLTLCIIIAFFIPLLVFSGTNDVIILFILNHPLCFTSTMIGYFLAVSFFVKSVGVLIGLPIMSNILKLSDSAIASTGVITNILSTVFLAFTRNRWQAFLAISTGIFNGITILSVRAMVSKMVDFDEQGSLFAVLACVETISTLVASLVFNNIYKWTVSTLPGLCFLVMAGILLLPLILMILFYRQQKTFQLQLQSNDVDDLIDSEESAA